MSSNMNHPILQSLYKLNNLSLQKTKKIIKTRSWYHTLWILNLQEKVKQFLTLLDRGVDTVFCPVYCIRAHGILFLQQYNLIYYFLGLDKIFLLFEGFPIDVTQFWKLKDHQFSVLKATIKLQMFVCPPPAEIKNPLLSE